MSREVKTGTPVIDQFPVFEDDGFSKRSGLVPGDFLPTLFRDSSIANLPVSIQEIGQTGDYRISFTPDLNGHYELQVLSVYDLGYWHAQYESLTQSDETLLQAIYDTLIAHSSSTGVLLAQVQADLARVLGLLHRNSILDLQAYDGHGQLTSARLRVFDSPTNVPATPGGDETVGLLQRYVISATYGGPNVVTKFTLKQEL